MAKRALKAPTPEYVLARYAELQRQHEADHKRLERIRERRLLTWEVNVPEAITEMTGATGLAYRDATIASELLDLPTMFTKQLPSLSLRAEKDTKEAEGLTTRLEHFTTAALFEDCGRREMGASTYERLVDATFEGGACTMLVKTKDTWDERYGMRLKDYEDDGDDVPEGKRRTSAQKYDDATEQAKKKAGVPIQWLSIDAADVYPGPNMTEVIIAQRRSLSATFREYRLGFDGDGHICPEETSVVGWDKQIDEGATVEFIQRWDATYATYLVRYSGGYKGAGGYSGGYSGSHHEIRTWRHGYKLGRPPVYLHHGLAPAFMRNNVVTWSASETKVDLVDSLSQMRTIFKHLAIRDAAPPMNRQLPVDAAPLIGADGKPLGPASYQAGKMYTGAPGEVVSRFDFPDNADKLQAEIVQIKQEIDDLSAMKTPGSTGDIDASGFALSVEREKDAQRFTPIGNSIKRHLTDVTVDFWKLVKSLGETVYVHRTAESEAGYVSVSPDDFEMAVRPTWTLNPDSVSAQIILERYLASRVANGTLSLDQAVERLGDNPDEVRKGRAKDRIRTLAWFMQMEEAEVLAEWGRGDVLKLQEQAEQMAAYTQQMQPPQVAAGGMGDGGLGAGGMVPDTGSLAMGQPDGYPAGPSVPTQGATAQMTTTDMMGQ